MRSRPAALAATAVLALASVTACSIEPTGVTGTVTARTMRYSPATKAWNYYLTINSGGHASEYRVYWSTYRHCPPASTYPACK